MRLIPLIVLLFLGCSERQNRSPEVIRAEVQKAMRAENYGAAVESLSALIELNPQDIEALIGRAAVRLLTGDATGAQEDFDMAIKIDAEDV